jgi:hypothetical protein
MFSVTFVSLLSSQPGCIASAIAMPLRVSLYSCTISVVNRIVIDLSFYFSGAQLWAPKCRSYLLAGAVLLDLSCGSDRSDQLT